MASFDENLTLTPNGPVDPYQGLPEPVKGWRCDQEGCGTRRYFTGKKSFYSHHGVCHRQQAKKFSEHKVQVLCRQPAGRLEVEVHDSGVQNPQSTSSASDEISTLLDQVEQNIQPASLPLESGVDVRHISPWLEKCRWHHYFEGKDIQSLIGLADLKQQPPTHYHLRRYVKAYFQLGSAQISNTAAPILHLLGSQKQR